MSISQQLSPPHKDLLLLTLRVTKEYDKRMIAQYENIVISLSLGLRSLT